MPEVVFWYRYCCHWGLVFVSRDASTPLLGGLGLGLGSLGLGFGFGLAEMVFLHHYSVRYRQADSPSARPPVLVDVRPAAVHPDRRRAHARVHEGRTRQQVPRTTTGARVRIYRRPSVARRHAIRDTIRYDMGCVRALDRTKLRASLI